MPLPLAQALVPDAYIEQFDPARDCRALYTLAAWCLRFSPLVALDDALFNARMCGHLGDISILHYGIILDLTGMRAFHGDMSLFASSLHALLNRSAHIAIAPTLGAAWALSRYAAPELPVIVESAHDIKQSLALLPTRALRIDDTAARLLSDVGITLIGQLLNLPRRSLSQRFGKFLLYRLDQALGIIEERIQSISPPHAYRTQKLFEPPLANRKTIVIAIHRLFSALLSQLKQHSKRARCFFLTITDAMNGTICKEFPLAAATDDINHLISIIDPIVEGMSFCGEVRKISFQAEQVEDALPEQRSLSVSQTASSDVRAKAELMNTFSVRLGRSRVLTASFTRSYLPERSFAYSSALCDDTGSFVSEPIAPYTLRERPSVLLSQPERVQTIAMLPDKPPSYILWRGKKIKIITGLGPERIAPEWWASSVERAHFAERDYFKVQDSSGRWLWVYREQQSLEWFLHGVWA